MNPGCEKCKYKDRNPHKEPCVNCWVFDERPNFEQRSTTNADHIRAMTVVELACFIQEAEVNATMSGDRSYREILEWLRSPVEVSDGQNAD